MTSSNDDTTGSPASRWPLATAQVAELFGVNAKTVTRWAKTGKLASIRTPGGHRRFRETDVKAFTDTVGGDLNGSTS
jgi:excisionase family DNA binding protein